MMRLLLCLSIALGAGSAAQAQSIESRLRAVENKTKNYAAVQKNKKKSFNRKSGDFRSITSGLVFVDVPLTELGPVFSFTWVTISGVYRSNAPVALGGIGGVSDGSAVTNYPALQVHQCNILKELPNSKGANANFEIKFLCSGSFNPQLGERFRVYASFPANAVVMDAITLSVKMVNYDQIEPE